MANYLLNITLVSRFRLVGVVLGILKLGGVQLGVGAFLRQQFVVAASFDNFTLVQYQDLIGVFDGAQAMGDDNGRSVF